MNSTIIAVFLVFMVINFSVQISEEEKVINLLQSDKERETNSQNEFEEELQIDLSWLNNVQIEVLNDLKEDGYNSSGLQKEVWLFFNSTKDYTRLVAAKHLLQFCENLITDETLIEIRNRLKKEINETMIIELYMTGCLSIIEEFIDHINDWSDEERILLELEELNNVNLTDNFNNRYRLHKKVDLLIKLVKYEEAIEVFDKLLILKPNSIIYIEEKADALVILEKYEEAIQFYNQILKNDSDNLKLIDKKVNALMKQSGQSYEKANEIICNNYFEHHFQWLNKTQNREIRKFKAEGKKSSKVFAKVFEFFQKISDDETKNEALHSMENGCIHFLYSILGNIKAENLMAIKENSSEIFEKKYTELFENIKDEEKKRIASEYMSTCRNILTFDEENPPEILISPKINGKTIEFTFDTGCDATVADKEVWEKIGQPYLHPWSKISYGIGGFVKDQLGRCRVTVEIDGKRKREWLHIVEKGFNLFGRNWIKLSGISATKSLHLNLQGQKNQ